jgi:hypothetical protein
MKKIVFIALIFGIIFSSVAFSFPTTEMDRQRDRIVERLINIVPVPEITTAQERKMVAWRATLFDVDAKLGYIYVWNAGIANPVFYFPVLGKVASLNSYLVPEETWFARSSDMATAADIDGTWGHNVEGVFAKLAPSMSYWEMSTNGCLAYTYFDKPISIWANVARIMDVPKK